ncbi:hypothetical protein GGI12_000758 [Dipsacomyces acuminosporus]|nr:hypothetical protein GGI12_000758 [Dipsacomyces acuminosporus]
MDSAFHWSVFGERVSSYLSNICARDKDTQRLLVLRAEEPIHLLLHLLDMSLKNNHQHEGIDRRFIFRRVADATAILATSPGACLPSSGLWLALTSFIGAFVSRNSLTDDGKTDAVEITRLIVSMIDTFPSDTQSTVLALVYSLGTRANCDIAQCISQLLRKCAMSQNTFLKMQTGELVIGLLSSGLKIADNGSYMDVYKLADDPDASVRNPWYSVLLRAVETKGLLAPTVHPFSGARQALSSSDCSEWSGDALHRGFGELSMADAMLVVSILSDTSQYSDAITPPSPYSSINLYTGFTDAALDVFTDLSKTAIPKPQLSRSMCSIIERIVACAAFRVCHSPSPGERRATFSHLVKLIHSQLAKLKAGGEGEGLLWTSRRRLYWLTELVFHLQTFSDPTLLLPNDIDTQLMLVEAAVECSNIGFAVFICQLVLQNHPADADSSTAVIDRIKGLAPWPLLRELVGGESGDALDLLTLASVKTLSLDGQQRVDQAGVGDIEAELYALSLSNDQRSATDSRSRLARFSLDGPLLDAVLQQPASSNAVSALGFGSRQLSPARYFENHGSDLLLFTDRFLDGSISSSVRCLEGMSRPFAFSLFKDVVVQRIRSPDADIALRLEAISWLSGSGYNRMALDTLTSVAVDSAGLEDQQKWWRLFTANVLAKQFITQQEPANWLHGLAEQLPVETIVENVSASARSDIIFALPPTSAPRNPFIYDMREDTGTICVDKLVSVGVDRTKALEALMYISPDSPDEGSIGELYTRLLMEGKNGIRLTAKGTFDPAAKLISRMSTNPSSVPRLQAQMLNANAIGQLSPYIPQLFSMLCYSESDSQPVSCSAAECALHILELLAKSAPDLVVFYATVASQSQPKSSRAGLRVGRLLRLFDTKLVADIQTFLTLAGKIMILPHERLRWVCTKAKSAYQKALDGYHNDSVSLDAVNDTLEPIYQLLNEYRRSEPQSPAETEFTASIPGLALLFDQLRLADAAGSNSTDDSKTVQPDHVWADAFKALNTQATLPMAYVCPKLAEFSARIPIPSLANPTEPLYFLRAGSNVRVIGSKTRPKLLTLHLATRSGEQFKEKYILKGSEDLRVDETVMQAFIRLNRVVDGGSLSAPDRHPDSSGYARLATYNVVPTGAFGGLIQVVENAPSLFYMYSQSANKQQQLQQQKAVPESKAPAGGRSGGGGSAGRPESTRPQHLNTQQIYNSHALRILKSHKIPAGTPPHAWPGHVVAQIYDSLVKSTPANILHEQLMCAAQSSSHLYLATKNIVKSIAVSSIAGYLLGLGDRHLDNLLVDVYRGQLIPIDFNVCFDFGGISRVPEQVPFRMTPVLQYICGSPEQLELPDGKKPFAFSRLFFASAAATLLFARMDKDALVNCIVSRAKFRPYMEWCGIEETWLKDTKKQQQQQQQNAQSAEDFGAGGPAVETRDKWASPPESESVADHQPSPCLSAADPRHRLSIAQSEELVRTTGLCPLNAFLPFGLHQASQQPLATEVPFGWRIAHAAIGRVSARLEFEGAKEAKEKGANQQEIANEQAMAVWKAATSRDRLTRMYVGWAPWI